MLNFHELKKNKFSRYKKIIPWVIAIVFFFCSKAVVKVFIDFKEDELQLKAKNETFNYGVNLIANFNRELNGLIYLSNGLAAYLKVNAQHIDSAEVNNILKETLNTSPIIRNIGIAIGTKLKFIQPIGTNENALGMDYKNFPDQWNDVEKAIQTGSGTLSLPINLVQGGKGLIYRKPIYVNNTFWGFLSTVLDMESLFTNAFAIQNTNKYTFAIREKNSNTLIYGSESVFKSDKLVLLNFTMPNTEWEYGFETRYKIKEATFLKHLHWLGTFTSFVFAVLLLYLLILRNRDKKSQLKIKQNEALFNAIVNTSYAGVSILNRSGEHVFTNDTCEKIHGYSTNEVLGSNIQNVLQNEDKSIVLKALADVLDDKMEVVDLTLRLKHKVTKKTVWIHAVITKFPKLTERSEDLVLVSFQNITDQKRILSELSDLNDTKDKFFSIIAHDLRSPFAGILGFLEILTQEDVADFSNKEIQMIMKNMLDTTKLTFDLLENLLTWAHSQSDALRFEPENIDVQELVFRIVALLSHNANQKQISINVDEIEPLHALADGFMVETILRNLLSNAIKFTPEQGRITIKTENNPSSKQMTISVADTGVGISEVVMAKMFSLDRNITSLGTNNEKGTGLGLHLCKEFVEKNGGQISVESIVGEGTRISFTLQLAIKKEV